MQEGWQHLDKRVQEYRSIFGSRIGRINRELSELLSRYSGHPLSDRLTYAIGGGKRLRPLITVLVYEALGGGDESPYPASLIGELLHTISLVHDDVIDKETTRRGRKPFYKIYGIGSSLLLADFVFSMILDIAASYRTVGLLEVISRTAMLMSEGEDRELQLLSRDFVTFDEYLTVISLKTASLFEAAAEIGSLLSGKSYCAGLASRFGWNLGMSYQLADDVEDVRAGRAGEILRMLDPPTSERKMLELANSYSSAAAKELSSIPQNRSRKLLEILTATIV